VSPFVLDNSVTMRWCFEQTSTPYSDAILQEMHNGAEAVVPVLWLYEVVSVLAKAQCNGSVTSDKASRFLDDLRSLSIKVDQERFDLIFTDVHRLAIQYGLTGYDASYLELAIRKSLPIATLDADLQKATLAAGVKLIQP
jgi:predicted nucleic acid-binding protein